MSETASAQLYPELASFVAERQREFAQIPRPRKDELVLLAGYIRHRVDRDQPVKLTFICTHNSRRSQLSQVWAKVAAVVYDVGGVETYSGGTEATAFNPRAVAALERSGLHIATEDAPAENPTYQVRHAAEAPPQVCFSKVFDQPPNPTASYCAVMTCSQADKACPVVSGCDVRAPIRYEDPKVSDDTPAEAAVYDERSRQICREMLFLMSQV